MTSLRGLIIDDEVDNRTNLGLLLKQYCPNVTILGEADGVKSGYEQILQLKPNLVFLDIEMQDGTGFDLLAAFNKVDFQIVFTTAYHQYAIQAIKANALDYLLKPIDILELGKAVERAEVALSQDRLPGVDQLLSKMQAEAQLPGRLPLHTNDELFLVEIPTIIRLEGDSNYTHVKLADGTSHLASKTLKFFQPQLEAHNFIRVHQSHLVNLAHVKRYHKRDGGYLVMSDGSEIGIARQRKEEVLKRLSNPNLH